MSRRPAEASAVLLGIRRDPVTFCREVLGFEPWSKQREILESVRDHPRTAVRSCHGAGKTAIAARVLLWFLAAHPRSRVITTAPTFHQLKNVLWREVHAAYAAAGGFIDGDLYDTRLELGDSGDWFAVGISTDRPDRFVGHHAEHLLLLVDEAAGVHQEIFDAAAGALTGPGARALLIGNPTQLAGEFFDAFHRNRASYNTISVSALDTPAFTGEQVPDVVLRRLVSREWVETHRQKWGETSPLWQVRVLGEFSSSSDDAVVSLAELEAAQARRLERNLPAVVACDVARFGSDETVIVVRVGPIVRLARSYVGHDTMRTVGEILQVARRTAKEHGWPPCLVVDDVGVGGGVTDRLRELGEFPVVPFNGAAAARARSDYPNRRSEVWFEFAELLPALDLDDDEQLAADLVSPRYSIDSQGRRVVEPKEQTKRRLGRSPDRADAVLMAFSVGWSGKVSAFSASDDSSRPSDDDMIAMRRERQLALRDGGRGDGDSPLDYNMHL